MDLVVVVPNSKRPQASLLLVFKDVQLSTRMYFKRLVRTSGSF